MRPPIHREKAEQAIGRSLPGKHPVHHVDGNPNNNANTNLVICENDAYHKLLHARANRIRRGLPLDEPFLNPTIRFRITSKLRARLLRIGKIREKKLSELGREGFVNYIQQEEERLGISKDKTKT